MKENLNKLVESVFSGAVIVAIFGGGVIFTMFLVAMVIGGTSGELLATQASKVIMPYFIRSASVAVFCGLISFYITGRHALSLGRSK